MSDEPVAIRHPKRGKAHRLIFNAGSVWSHRKNFDATACDQWVTVEAKNLSERVPLSQTDPSDRCKRCWPGAPRD